MIFPAFIISMTTIVGRIPADSYGTKAGCLIQNKEEWSMRMYDLIMKKRNGGVLTKEEIEFMIQDYTNGKIPRKVR